MCHGASRGHCGEEWFGTQPPASSSSSQQLIITPIIILNSALPSVSSQEMWLPMHRRPSFMTKKCRREQLTTYPSFLLPHPKTKKLSRENKVIEDMEIGHSSMQGYRTTMEDQHVIDKMSSLPNHVLVAIMDGKKGVTLISHD